MPLVMASGRTHTHPHTHMHILSQTKVIVENQAHAPGLKIRKQAKVDKSDLETSLSLLLAN